MLKDTDPPAQSPSPDYNASTPLYPRPYEQQSPPYHVNSYSTPPPGSQSPPGHYGTTAQPHLPPYPQATPVAVLYAGPNPYAASRARRRFCNAILCLFLTWFLFSSLFGGLWKGFGWGWSKGSTEVIFPPMLNVQRCTSTWKALSTSGFESNDTATTDSPWNEFPYSSWVSFDLPVDSKALFLLSRGSLTTGSVNIVASETQPSNKVHVQVVVRYYDEDLRDLAKVCSVQKGQGENGVGIFTPAGWEFNYRRRLRFEATVTFPTRRASGSSRKLSIKNFETDLVNMAQTADDLGSGLEFETITLANTNGHVNVKSLVGTALNVRASNGGIRGSFNATYGGVFLKTTNGVVDVDVALTAGHHVPATSEIRSTNGGVKARIHLTSDSRDQTGDFKVATVTSNGGLDVSFPSAPIYSKLEYEGRTSNAHAKVALNPEYEGSFHIKTSNAAAHVDHVITDDPSGRGRKRVIRNRRVTGREVIGKVYWQNGSEEEHEGGSASVQTSNGRVTLEL